MKVTRYHRRHAIPIITITLLAIAQVALADTMLWDDGGVLGQVKNALITTTAGTIATIAVFQIGIEMSMGPVPVKKIINTVIALGILLGIQTVVDLIMS